MVISAADDAMGMDDKKVDDMMPYLSIFGCVLFFRHSSTAAFCLNGADKELLD